MPKQKNVRVTFHRRGEDVETAWCVPLATKGHYRLENILFLHEKPVWGDIIEATESDRFDGQLALKKIVKPCGRHVAIVDYPKPSQFEKLREFLRERYGAESEGCFGPTATTPGRMYVALPARHAAKDVLIAAGAAFDGLVAVHPKVRGMTETPRAAQPKKIEDESGGRAAPKAATLFDAIDRNDGAAFATAKPSELEVLDERGRSLLVRAVLFGRTAIVETLIARGAEVNPKTPRDFAPLRAAAMRDRPKEAKLLLAAGAKPELARDADGDPPLVIAAFRESLAVLRVFLAAAHTPADRSLALLEAAGVGHLAIVKLLVRSGADPEWRSDKGNSALSIARKRKRREIVAYFESLSARVA